LWLVSLGKVEVVLLDGYEPITGGALIAPIREVAGGNRASQIAGFPVPLPDRDQPFLIAEIERPQDKGVNGARHRRNRAGAQRRCQQSREGYASVFQQDSRAITQVLAQSL